MNDENVTVQQSTALLDLRICELQGRERTLERLRALQEALDKERAGGRFGSVSRLTSAKTRYTVLSGYEVTGFVLTKGDEVILIDKAACRHLSKEDWWELFHGERNPAGSEEKCI